jgi:hypothetical protein
MKMFFILGSFLVLSTSSFAGIFCQFNSIPNPQGFSVEKVIGLVDINFSDEGQNTFIIKQDGSVLKNVSYGAAMMENPSETFGDVDGAALISVTRNQGSDKGINLFIARLANSQKMAQIVVDSDSKENDLNVGVMDLGIRVGCRETKSMQD